MTAPGGRRLAPSSRDGIARALDRATGSRPIPGNQAVPLVDGPAIFEAAFDLIDQAGDWIHFDNYIFRDDRTGRRFAEALARAAGRGVRVRVLVDYVGSWGTAGRFWAALRRAGIEVRRFGRPRLGRPIPSVIRDHRKLLVADGRDALVGGFCIGNEWAGDENAGVRPWRETALRIKGPAASVLDQAFAQIWARAGPPLNPAEQAAEVPEAGDIPVRVLAGEPFRLRTFRTTELLMALSGERIWVTDAYLVPPRRVEDALIGAGSEGVDVRLLVPGVSDLPIVRSFTRVGYRRLLRHGVRIFEWQGSMLHAKTIVIDGHWVRIGSSNLNPSSLLGNYELDVLIEDPALADRLETQFRRDLDASAEIVRQQIGPERLGRFKPVTLAVQAGRLRNRTHRPSGRERRARAARALRVVVAGARRTLLLPVGLTAVVLALLFLLLPRAMGLILGVILAALAVLALIGALGRPEAP